MMSKEEIEKAFEGMEYFVDDDFGGHYENVVGNQDANSMLKYLKIRDNILNMQNKIEQLESDKQKLIEKLEGDIEDLEFVHDNYIDANIVEGTYETLGRISYAKEILKILKGENDAKI